MPRNTDNFDVFDILMQHKLGQNKVRGSSHSSGCAAEWVGEIFCLPDAAWMELTPLERGKVRTGAGRERFPLSHENSIAVPAARLFQSLPPNQTALMTYDPGMWPLEAGQRLASVILRPHHPPLYCPSLQPFTHSHTHTLRAQWTQGTHLSSSYY